MDKNVDFIESLPPESLKLILNQEPFFQKQHSDYWSIDGMVPKDYDLFICTGGKAEFQQGENKCILEEGVGFLAEPGIPLFAKHRGETFFTATAQHFDLKIFGELDFFSMIEFRNRQVFSNWDYIQNSLLRYKNLVTTQTKKLEQHSLMFSLICEFIYDSFISESSNQQENYYFILQMISYIQSHLTETDVLEKSLLLSPYSHDYTSRVFKKRIGLPPQQYISQSRLTLSRNYLLQNLSVKETAFRCGFSDELYFSRLFKKNLHISPTEFRKQNELTHSSNL